MTESLENLHPKRLLAKEQQDILILDIREDGVSDYRRISLRGLLELINEKSLGTYANGQNIAPIHYRDLRHLDYQLNPSESIAIILRYIFHLLTLSLL